MIHATPTPRFRVYVLPLLIGSVFGMGIFFALQQGDVLYTSIGGVPVSDDIAQSDLVVTQTATQDLVITVMKHIPDIESISLIVTYDPVHVKIEESDISSPVPLQVTRANDGQLVLMMQEIGTIEPKTPLVTIHPTGDSAYITLSDVIASFADGITPLIVSSLPN